MSNKTLNRRKFLMNTALGVTGSVFVKDAASSERSVFSGQKDENHKLVTRQLGKTGLKLPVVSFGVMRADSPNLVKAALAAGIKHLDTAYVYQNGNNEKMLGDVLKDYPRDSFTIATKVKPEEKDAFLEKLDTSLERLKMDYVDILYLHAVSSRDEVLSKNNLDALQTAKKQGKALHIGLSTHKNEPEVIKAAIESGVYKVILTAYNFKQDHKDQLTEAIQQAAKAGIGIVAMKTMAGGRLGKDAEEMHYQAALKWALNNKHVHTSIPGLTSFKDLEENMAVMNNLDFTKEEEAFLSYAATREGLYCNGCEQCTETCREHLPIPEVMRAYMYVYGYGEMRKAKQEVVELGMSENPCTNCTVCTVRCPKGFNVPAKMADVLQISNVPDRFLA